MVVPKADGNVGPSPGSAAGVFSPQFMPGHKPVPKKSDILPKKHPKFHLDLRLAGVSGGEMEKPSRPAAGVTEDEGAALDKIKPTMPLEVSTGAGGGPGGGRTARGERTARSRAAAMKADALTRSRRAGRKGAQQPPQEGTAVFGERKKATAAIPAMRKAPGSPRVPAKSRFVGGGPTAGKPAPKKPKREAEPGAAPKPFKEKRAPSAAKPQLLAEAVVTGVPELAISPRAEGGVPQAVPVEAPVSAVPPPPLPSPVLPSPRRTATEAAAREPAGPPLYGPPTTRRERHATLVTPKTAERPPGKERKRAVTEPVTVEAVMWPGENVAVEVTPEGWEDNVHHGWLGKPGASTLWNVANYPTPGVPTDGGSGGYLPHGASTRAETYLATNVDTPDMIISKNKQLYVLLEEEREAGAKLHVSYEKQLQRLRQDNVRRLSEAREGLLHEIDHLLKQYQGMANRALQSAMDAHRHADKQKHDTQRMAELGCRRFETEMKKKVSEVLDGYRYLADHAQITAKQETRALKQKCRELQDKLLHDHQKFREQFKEEADEREAGLRREISKLERELQNTRGERSSTVRSLKTDVARECERFERMLMSACLELLWSKGVSISEVALRDKVLAAHRKLKKQGGNGDSEPSDSKSRQPGPVSVTSPTQLKYDAAIA